TSGGVCTLRAAIQEANADVGCGEINISINVSGTISLATALPSISHIVNISGPGATQLTLQRSTANGTPNFRVLTIDAVSATISGLTISNGSSFQDHGGGIFNAGVLALSDINITGNKTLNVGAGGGLFNQ